MVSKRIQLFRMCNENDRETLRNTRNMMLLIDAVSCYVYTVYMHIVDCINNVVYV